jgi:uncharacterized protein (TIGR03437 family)
VTRHRVFQVFQASGILLVLSSSALAQFSPAPNPPYPFPFAVGASPISVVVGNFNSALSTSRQTQPLPVSVPDLAVLSQFQGSVTLILNNGPISSSGTGGFTTAPNSPFSVGTGPPALKLPSSMAIGAFNTNNNGYQDLAISNQGDNTLTVLLGDGNGGFITPPLTLGPFPGGDGPDFVATGMFGTDTYPDLAIANRSSNNVTVLKGDGSGGFKAIAGSPFNVGSSPSCVAVGDFNGDGYQDLAITNELDNTVTVYLGNAAGGFTQAPASPFAVGENPSFVVVADFNGDGNPDLAIANITSNNVTVLLGNGTGFFTPAPGSPFAVGTSPVSMAMADFNGDLIPDLAIANFGSNNVTVLLGAGTGAFKPATGSPYMSGGTSPRSIAVGDFNADGLPDLAIANYASDDVTVLLNTFNTTPVMVSAASYSATAPVAPGSIVSIFGVGLSSLTADATLAQPPSPSPLPSCLGWLTVTLNDSSGVKNQPLSLYSIGATQINAVIPKSAATGAATFTVTPSSASQCSGPPPVSSQTSASQKGSVTLATVAPALFSADGTGKGPAAGQFVLDLGTGASSDLATCPAPGATPAGMAPNCTPNLLDVGSGDSVLVLYGTGIRNAASLAAVTVTIGAQTLAPFYAGAASYDPGGKDQVNVLLPKSLAGSGTVFATVSIAAAVSNQVTLNFM